MIDIIIFGVHARSGNWNISLETQPARSPDCNILDLPFLGPTNPSVEE